MEIEGHSCSKDTSETGDFVAVYRHSSHNLFHQTIAGGSDISTDLN